MPDRDTGRILITRTRPGADAMAAALTQAGHAVAVCPVIEIEPVRAPEHEALARRLDRFDAVIAVSAAAVDQALPLLQRHWPVPPEGLAWITVGRATAEALGSFGIAAERPDDERSEGVLELPALARARRVLLLCGRGGRDLLVQKLRRRGAEVTRLECYRRRVPERSPLLRLGITPGAIAAIVVSSGEGGEALARFWREAGGSMATPVIVPSRRVATLMRQEGFSRIRQSHGASASAVRELLARDDLGAGTGEP